MKNTTSIKTEKPSVESNQPLEQAPVEQAPSLPKKNKSLTVGLGVVFAVLIGTVGFLLYRNAQLKNRSVRLPAEIPLQTTTPSSTTTTDPIASWKTYTNNIYNYSVNLPENWTNYSMNDFSSQPFTNSEEQLYLGPENSPAKPPQIMQISTYNTNAYQETEMYPPANCTITTVSIGVDQIQAKHKICKGMESNGFITVKTSQFVFIIDELKGSEENHQLFTQILSTFKFTN